MAGICRFISTNTFRGPEILHPKVHTFVTKLAPDKQRKLPLRVKIVQNNTLCVEFN